MLFTFTELFRQFKIQWVGIYALLTLTNSFDHVDHLRGLNNWVSTPVSGTTTWSISATKFSKSLPPWLNSKSVTTAAFCRRLSMVSVMNYITSFADHYE